MGPVDYIVVGFDGNNFDGSIMKELSDAVEKGLIRVLDLLFIMKDEDGNITEGEYVDQSNELRDSLKQLEPDENLPLLSDEDIDKVGKRLDNDASAGILVVEHLWAKGIKRAMKDAGGVLLDYGRIQPEAIERAVKELANTK